MDITPPGVTAQSPLFDVPDEQIVQSSRSKGWHGIDIAEILHPHEDFALPAIPRHILVVNLSSPIEIKERLVGRQAHLGTGNLVILPAGAPTAWHLEPQGEVRHLHLYLSPAFIHKIAVESDMNPDTLELIPAMGTPDPQIESIALSLLGELRSDGLGGKIYVESLANILAVQLLRQHSSSSTQQSSLPRSRSLARATLKPALAYIEDNLATNLSLSELAASVNLSPYYFARLFKATIGLPPHQYVIQRRIERAKLLLAGTNQSLTIIAQATGFASESHLALHFRRLTGVAPGRYLQ